MEVAESGHKGEEFIFDFFSEQINNTKDKCKHLTAISTKFSVGSPSPHPGSSSLAQLPRQSTLGCVNLSAVQQVTWWTM